MKESKFSEIYEKIVKPSLLEALSKKEHWKSFYSDDKFNRIKEYAYGEYCRINSDLHDAFNNPNSLIDRHKIATAFYLSFLSAVRYCPIAMTKCIHPKINSVTDFLYHHIAFRSALSIIANFIITTENNIEGYKNHLINNGLNPPPKLICGNAKISYFDYAVLQILKTSIKMKDASRLEEAAFLISDTFFHIERNSRDTFFCKCNKQP
ncbi:MAG: hypothetical protein LBH25_06755 [Fibromonadaceae bacterium]|jgi:hypothetical protein|nr:hypothetical protein [Fibromonadaceae bacterium]